MARRPLMLEKMPKANEVYPDDWDGRTSISIEDWREMWGIPDWHDADAYPQRISPRNNKPAGYVELSQDQWRWEFLRRDSDYREDSCVNWMDCEPVNKNPEFFIFAEDEDYRFAKEPKSYLPFYDLYEIVDPRLGWQDVPQDFFIRRHQGKRITQDGAFEIPDLIKNDKYEIFVFDKNRPLAAQIARAQKRLDVLQREAATAQKQSGHKRGSDYNVDDVIINDRFSDDFRRMLRLIDACMERAKKEEIGKVLYNIGDYATGQSRINKDMHIATRMWEWL
jgi:hypothetical protein